MMQTEPIDIRENELAVFNNGKVLRELLTDQTRKKILLDSNPENLDPDAFIYWATQDYAGLGEGYSAHDEIRPELITGDERGQIVMPRVLKDKNQQIARSKDKAEVFTPAWVCNTQNNLIDEAWFGKKGLFNDELIDPEGNHIWVSTERVDFSGTGKTWQEYVKDIRMEITCGEAPYLVSRYDATTGEMIPVKDRIGLLDRKLRGISENASDHEEWMKYAYIAYRSVYGYEWQGDSLLLAREAFFWTFIDFHIERFGVGVSIHPNSLLSLANIISWNLWQMDGLKFVIPESCHSEEMVQDSLFGGDDEKTIIECEGCRTGDNHRHNGIYPLVRDWNVYDDYHKDKFGRVGKERSDIPFIQYCK